MSAAKQNEANKEADFDYDYNNYVNDPSEWNDEAQQAAEQEWNNKNSAKDAAKKALDEFNTLKSNLASASKGLRCCT